MYLYKKTYVKNWDHQEADEKHTVTIVGPKAKEIKPERISEITEEVAYWRKANQVHKWFVDNVQNGVDDCDHYSVGKKELRELLRLCKVVLESSIVIDGKVRNGKRYENGAWVSILVDGKTIENPVTAAALLPTTSGFFFGGADYDQYYIDDLKYTVETIEALLAEPNDYADYEYHSSW